MANSTPHTHQAQLARAFRTAGGTWQVTYGDTTVSVKPRWFPGNPVLPTFKATEKRVRRALAKAIKQHDEGSRALSKDEALQEIIRETNARLRPDTWASGVA